MSQGTPIKEEKDMDHDATVKKNGELGLLDDPDEGKTGEERAAEEKRLLRMLDLKLIPWLSFLYLVSFLDRTNIGNARIAGMYQDLNLTDGKYNAALSIFFVSYALFEPVTNALLKRFKPSVFITVSMILWGICLTSMGLVENFAGLATARFFLVLKLSLGPRRVCAGESIYLIIFLSTDDRRRVIRRLREDNQASADHEDFQMAYAYAALRDWKTYAFAVIYMGADGALYAFSLFLPSIIRELGYSATTANLLSVPPYACGAALTVLVGWYADRSQRRGWCNVGVSLFGVLGFSLLTGTTVPGLKYAATFLGALGIYPCIANTIVWTANNTEGVYKRGVTLGIVIGWGNLNGVMSSNIYQSRDAPNYRPGHGVVVGYISLFLTLGSLFTHFMLERENKLRRAGKRDHTIEGKTEEELHIMGDNKPDFLYVT